MQFYRTLIFCFFISGATALIYEVVWVRLLALVFGNTVYAIGVVLTAFMSGLSLGSFLLGRFADNRTNMLKLYGILEVGIAIFAVISPELLNQVTSIYASVYHSSAPLWMISVLRYFLSIVVLLVPTTLMGGTLPVLSRYFIRSENELEKRIGTLYSINTIGGVIGTFFVGFILIRFLGISLTINLAAILNLCIGIISYYLGLRIYVPEKTGTDQKEESYIRPQGYKFALVAFFLSGFSAMIYQVAWSRLLVSVIGSTTYAFSLILMGFLLGIGLGSLVVSRVSSKRRLDMLHFSTIQISIGIICFLTLILFNLMPSMMLQGLKLTGNSFNKVLIVEFLLVLIYILVPTTLFGATFPIIAGVYSGGSTHRGRNIGNIYAANTAGAILGSALAAFLLLPVIGSSLSIRMAIVINVVVGITGFLVMRRKSLFAASAVLLIIPLLPVNISHKLLNSGVAVYGTYDNFSLKLNTEFLLYSKEGLNATISVSTERAGNISLRTNGKSDASLAKEDMSTQVALGYFPIMLHPEPKKVLVIGLGSGVTVKTVKDFPSINVIDTIEIEPAVVEAAGFFDMVNNEVQLSPDVRIILDDARNYIGVTRETYDIIISEPSNPWISGIGNLFSKEFYESLLSRLEEDGIFCQWVQLYGLRPEDFRTILKTFSSVFSESTIWQSSHSDILLIGFKKQIDHFDYRSVEERISGEAVWNLKAYLKISDPLDFFSYFVTDKKGVASISSGAHINTDNLPLLEFNAPYAMYLDTTRSNNLLLHEHMILPKITGIHKAKDISSELLYRKSYNYSKLNILLNLLWIERAIMHDPQNADYLVQIAKQFKTMGENNKSVHFLNMGLNSAPENYHANYEMAMLLRKTDREKAGNYFDKAVALKGNEYDVIYEAAKFYLDEGEIEKALNYFVIANNLPHHVTDDQYLLYYTGICLWKLNNYKNALSYFKKSIEKNPYSMNVQMALGDSYLFLRNPDAACKYFKEALRVSTEENRGVINNKITTYCQN